MAEHDFPQLVHITGLAPTIKENPPLIYHWRETGHEEFMEIVREAFARYRETLPEHRRMLLDRFKIMDVAIKVVGVGSVGTWCAVILLMASDNDPLFLQVKEARPSVLEAYAGKSVHPNHGQRSRGRLPTDAIGQRSLPRLDGRKAWPALLSAPTEGHEDQDSRRGVHPERHAAIC